MATIAAAVIALHVLAWGAVVLAAPRLSVIAGLTVVAYVLGLRHAIDADHIAAIDGTTRRLIHAGQPARGVGFFFSLGHSTVVFALALWIAHSARVVQLYLPQMRAVGGRLGLAISSAFLLLIAAWNAVVFVDALRAPRARPGVVDAASDTNPARRGGIVSRLLRRVLNVITRPWQMYLVGMAFGLGFDTATEIALLALAAIAASKELPLAAVLALPCAFAAGMSLVDSAQGALMARAYRWAADDPARRRSYNCVITGVTAAAAAAVAIVQLVALAAASHVSLAVMVSLGATGV